MNIGKGRSTYRAPLIIPKNNYSPRVKSLKTSLVGSEGRLEYFLFFIQAMQRGSTADARCAIMSTPPTRNHGQPRSRNIDFHSTPELTRPKHLSTASDFHSPGQNGLEKKVLSTLRLRQVLFLYLNFAVCR